MKNKDPVPFYCWDTTVFLAWINEEKKSPLADIKLIAREIDNRKANLLVPVTIRSEILRSKLTAEQRKKLDLFLKRSNVIQASITNEIADKAGEIRDACEAMKPKRKLKTPDATIIAAAIVFGCDALHTLDEQCLRLGGGAAVDGLKIVRPVLASGQKALNLG